MSALITKHFLQALPKCEHHLHIEGTLEPSLLFQLARRNGISLPSHDPAFASVESLSERYLHFTSLDDFLHYYYIGMNALRTEQDYTDLAWQYFLRAKQDGVRHAELSFDPQGHLSRGVAYTTVLKGLQAARERALAELDISSTLIFCFLRHLPVAESEQLFQDSHVQASLRDGTVSGIGLDSSEMDFPPHLFQDLYAQTSLNGLTCRRTAHAGEEASVSFIESALDDLKVERIDHGIRLIDDTDLVDRVAREKIMLTVCPLSNVCLRCVKSVSELPIPQFLDKKVRFSLNSDDPAYFGGYCLDNYVAVQKAFNLDVDDWRYIVESGIEGSWCNDERKAELLKELQGVIDDMI